MTGEIILKTGDAPSPPASGVSLYATNAGLNMLYVSGCSVSLASGADGWTNANETWSYKSASAITIPSDGTTKYAVGDKIRWKQGGAYKYAYVISSASEVIQVTGGSDYTVANDIITDNYYSHVVSPIGFPQGFNWTPQWTNLNTGDGTLVVARFIMLGKMVYFYFKFVLGASSGITGSVSFTSPIEIASSMQTTAWPLGQSRFGDATGSSYNGVVDILNSKYFRLTTHSVSGTSLTATTLSSTVPFTWTTNDILQGQGFYESV